jgi:hypothetical protein
MRVSNLTDRIWEFARTFPFPLDAKEPMQCTVDSIVCYFTASIAVAVSVSNTVYLHRPRQGYKFMRLTGFDPARESNRTKILMAASIERAV